MSGFILLARDLLDNGLWRGSNDTFRLFVYLCISANFGKKEYTYSRGAVTVTVRKGEYLRSMRKIGEDCAYTGNNRLVVWSSSRVSGMLKQLERDGRIQVLSNSSTLGTHIKVVNYESFQSFLAYKEGGLGTDAEQMQPTSSPIVKQLKTINKQQVDELWAVWLDELSPKPPHPRLTSKRESVLMALHTEQLSSDGTDPLALFRKVLKTVKDSPHHMATRAYHLPESLFRTVERRESWTHRALAKAEATNRTPTVSRNWSVDT